MRHVAWLKFTLCSLACYGEALDNSLEHQATMQMYLAHSNCSIVLKVF